MRIWTESAARRFARFATDVSVSRPQLWRLLRRPVRSGFDQFASSWEQRFGPEGLVPLGAALERLDRPPVRVLDLGTGTGKAARVIARLFPDAQIEGVDLSPVMIEEATRLLPAEFEGRVTFRVADAAELPYEDDTFDLIVLLNMIPFFDELARVVSSGGALVFAFSFGEHTPIYVAPEKLKEKLAPLGFGDFEDIAAGQGTALIARSTT